MLKRRIRCDTWRCLSPYVGIESDLVGTSKTLGFLGPGPLRPSKCNRFRDNRLWTRFSHLEREALANPLGILLKCDLIFALFLFRKDRGKTQIKMSLQAPVSNSILPRGLTEATGPSPGFNDLSSNRTFADCAIHRSYNCSLINSSMWYKKRSRTTEYSAPVSSAIFIASSETSIRRLPA